MPRLGQRDLNEMLQRLPDIWQALQGASIFMTGGTGWFGKNLLEAFVAANHVLNSQLRVTVLTRSPERFSSEHPHLARAEGISLLEGDVCDFRFPQASFSHVIHAATASAHETFTGMSPHAKFNTLVNGTQRVIAFAKQAEVKHFLFTSSGAVYGPSREPNGIPETELSAPPTDAPETALGQAKRTAEFLCTLFGQETGCNVNIARCFSFVGPYMPLDLHYAIGNFIGSATQGKDIIIQSDGRSLRSYLYTTDLVVWLLKLMLRTGSPRVFNVGSDQAVSITELANRVKELINPAVRVRILNQQNYSIGNPPRDRYVPNIDRAKQEQNLQPWTSLAQAIEYTLNFQTNPVGFN